MAVVEREGRRVAMHDESKFHRHIGVTYRLRNLHHKTRSQPPWLPWLPVVTYGIMQAFDHLDHSFTATWADWYIDSLSGYVARVPSVGFV